ncbi:MAG: FliH/SctL family protein [Pseudomonadota bacterium]
MEHEIASALVEAEKHGHSTGMAQTKQLLERVEHLADGLLKEVEPQAVEAAIAVARQLIEAELAEHPRAIVAVVRQALLSARQQRDVFVRVNPVHVETLREHRREVVDVLGRAKDIDVREDPDLAPGGCMVETEIGTIDARLETQFEALVRHLTGGGR